MYHIQFFKILINLIEVLFIGNSANFIFLTINVIVLDPNRAHLQLLDLILIVRSLLFSFHKVSK